MRKHNRLEAIRLDAVKASQEADEAWRKADDELAQYLCARNNHPERNTT